MVVLRNNKGENVFADDFEDPEVYRDKNIEVDSRIVKDIINTLSHIESERRQL